MTTLQGMRKWVGLGKQGETFLANMFGMVQPVLPAHHRAILSLSLMQYKKLKASQFVEERKKLSNKTKMIICCNHIYPFTFGRSCAASEAATKSVSVPRARAASGLQSSFSKNLTTAPRWCCGGSTATSSGCWATLMRLAKSSPPR